MFHNPLLISDTFCFKCNVNGKGGNENKQEDFDIYTIDICCRLIGMLTYSIL